MVTKIPQFLRDFWYNWIADTAVAFGRASLDFPSIGAGLQATLTITTVPAGGALLGDFVDLGLETALEAGLAYAPPQVTAADTVTVTLINNTAGAIDATAKVHRVTVRRQGRTS